MALPVSSLRTGVVAALATLVMLDPALAHHATGGATPSTFVEGLLSGLGHPVIGLDHLAFVIAVGIASAFVPRSLFMPLVFVMATAAGVVIHLGAVDLPLVEPVIALSVVLAGVLIALRLDVPAAAWVALFAFAGVFHGYAYGAAIIGAETTPLGAYVLGFSAIQYAVAAGACLLTQSAVAASRLDRPQIAGGVVAGVGLVFAAEALMPF